MCAPGFILKAKNPHESCTSPSLAFSSTRARAGFCLITAARLVRHPHRQHSMSFPHQKLPRLSGIYGPQSMHLSIHASHLAASAADTLPLASAALPPQVSPDGANVGDRSRAPILRTEHSHPSSTPAACMSAEAEGADTIDYSRPVSPVSMLGQASDD